MGIAAFCTACGAPLTASSGFCGSCGAPIPTAGATGSAVTTPLPKTQTVTIGPSANPLACPRCMEVDQAAKVSSVIRKEVSNGTVGGSFAGAGYQFGEYGGLSLIGGGIHLSTQSMSALGRMLAPPAPPVYQSPWGAGVVIGILILGIAGLSLLGSGSTQGTGAPILGLLCLAIIVAIIVSRTRTAARRKREYAESIPYYQRAAQRWDEMYVCLRCDACYTPGSSDIYRMEHLRQVIYGT